MPSVKTGGLKTISFYTSDVRGRYAVLAQGIGQIGEAGSGVLLFDVK